MSNSVEDLPQMIHDLLKESFAVGLKINMKKSKVMSNSLAVKQPFVICSAILEEVDQNSYLGQLVSADPSHEKEIRRRIGFAWGAFRRHFEIMTSTIPLSLKRKEVNGYILHVLFYGAETWSITNQLERKLRSAQRAMERKMIRFTRRDNNAGSND